MRPRSYTKKTNIKKANIRKNDRVEILQGKDIGKQGKILKVLPKEGRVIVEGINIVHRHTKPSQEFPQGGIIENEAPIHISNVQLVCDHCGEVTRTGRKILDGKRRVRYCKKCDEIQER